MKSRSVEFPIFPTFIDRRECSKVLKGEILNLTFPQFLPLYLTTNKHTQPLSHREVSQIIFQAIPSSFGICSYVAFVV